MVDKKPRGKRSNSEMSSSSSSSTSSFSSDEETDDGDLKPIRGYLLNRRELSRQLFMSVKTEKIRMMLPQILKNMNITDLEEWCASELCGMSEARILCILNGQPMLDSSDTGDTDDSGPSLEIISDTEEWLTDTDVPIKEEPSVSGAPKSKRIKANKVKGKTRAARKIERNELRTKAKAIAAGALTNESEVAVKKENRGSVNKEGESLLDLLELEMRARAIRALIRKEEDVIPSAASEKRMALTANALRNTLNSAVSASLSNEKSLNGKFNLGETAGNACNDKNSVDKPGGHCSKLMEIGEDEDVVFVGAPPTPTIELLSSDNDNENDNENDGKDRNNKDADKRTDDTEGAAKSGRQLLNNKNDRTPEAALSLSTVTSERIVTIDKSGDGPDNLKIVITKRVSESSGSPSPTKLSKSKKVSVDKTDKNGSTSVMSGNEKSTDKTIAEPTQSAKGLFKKIKKKQHLRSKRKANCEDTSTDRDQADETRKIAVPPPVIQVTEIDSDVKDDAETAAIQPVTTVKLETRESKEDEREAKRKLSAPIKSDEDRLDDFEEIIDLDAYSEDMEEMENNDKTQSTNDDVVGQQTESQPKTLREDAITKEASDSAETWASRYYQTDDVQNVIKESKIQSEIRKRLRERQRLSKLNSSPKLNCPGDATVTSEKPEEKNDSKPTGSVQEYLALKNASSSSVEVSEVCNDNSTPVMESPDSVVPPSNNLVEDVPTNPIAPESAKTY